MPARDSTVSNRSRNITCETRPGLCRCAFLGRDDSTQPDSHGLWNRTKVGAFAPLLETQHHPPQTGRGSFALKADGVAAVLRVIALVAATALIVWFLADVLLLIFLAVLIAVMLRGVSNALARHTGMGETAALSVVVLSVAVLVVGFGYYVGPRLTAQAQDLWSQLNSQADRLRQTYSNTPWGHFLFQRLSPSPQLESRLANSAESVATSTIGALTSALILIVTALYFAISPQLYVDGVVSLFPPQRRARVHSIMQDVTSTLRWWSLGQLIDMAVVGVLTGIGLTLLGIPLSLALGVLAGLLTFVPYFGAIVAAVPAVLVALTVSVQSALWVIVIFLGCHGIEGYVVSPLVQRRTVHMPPALTLLSMTILGTAFGALGVILGTPIAAAGLVIVREAYVRDVLEEGAESPPAGRQPL
ncbi:MAG: AI-2E family transporter [Acetobacteraceae bacterium]|nr:AI-2E family transporter [Acetobacteraceae bacterium]